jgi:hypothetical protein
MVLKAYAMAGGGLTGYRDIWIFDNNCRLQSDSSGDMKDYGSGTISLNGPA